MDQIIIQELEVAYRVGVSEDERATPQRLMLNLELQTDFSSAGTSDRLEHTIDYFQVTRRLLAFGEGRSWRLLEKLAEDVANLILTEFQADSVMVEVRKFIIHEARYVAVRIHRGRSLK